MKLKLTREEKLFLAKYRADKSIVLTQDEEEAIVAHRKLLKEESIADELQEAIDDLEMEMEEMPIRFGKLREDMYYWDDVNDNLQFDDSYATKKEIKEAYEESLHKRCVAYIDKGTEWHQYNEEDMWYQEDYHERESEWGEKHLVSIKDNPAYSKLVGRIDKLKKKLEGL